MSQDGARAALRSQLVEHQRAINDTQQLGPDEPDLRTPEERLAEVEAAEGLTPEPAPEPEPRDMRPPEEQFRDAEVSGL